MAAIKKTSITAENTWTDSLDIENSKYTISITGLTAGSGTVTVQRKRPLDSTWRDDSVHTSDVEAVGEAIGKWQYRIGTKTGEYTSGTFNVEIGR